MIRPAERAALLAANNGLHPWAETVIEQGDRRAHLSKGWVRNNHLFLVPHKCTLPGRGYSWPGSVSDCTLRGVYLHETGHIVHGQLPNERAVLIALRALGGPRVTGYEPNAMETFAETWRLFAGNPALLAAGRPWRYEFMLRLGLHPMPNMPRAWEQGLIGTPPQRFYDQCERWIARGRTGANP